MTATQLQLPIPAPPAPTLTLCGMVYDIMRDGEWRTPYEVQRMVERLTGQWHSDSSICARLRDLRKPAYGSHTIEKRPVEGQRSYVYRMVD